MKIIAENPEYKKLLEKKINSKNLSDKKIAYYKRMQKLLKMPDLSETEWNPIEMIIKKIINSKFYSDFEHIKIPEIVKEYETFDLFNFPKNHVARRESDSYFIEKNSDNSKNILLRPHTSVMWYYYLVENNAKEILEKTGEIKALSWWKVYRVDELDKTHHECFHQIDGLKITSKKKEIINQETLKEVLSNTIKSIYPENIKYRFHKDNFPYTLESLEVEVFDNGKWLEVLWAWIVHPSVLESLWIDSEKYNGWAFGFWIDRLAMAFKKIPDIRILWSFDKRILSQWWNYEAYKQVSNYPAITNDISFIVEKNKFIQDFEETKKSWEVELTTQTENDSFEIAWIARDVWENLIEEVKVTDIYENDKKFWKNKKSITIRITFRSLERTLKNDEINEMYLNIREKLEKDLGYELR